MTSWFFFNVRVVGCFVLHITLFRAYFKIIQWKNVASQMMFSLRCLTVMLTLAGFLPPKTSYRVLYLFCVMPNTHSYGGPSCECTMVSNTCASCSSNRLHFSSSPSYPTFISLVCFSLLCSLSFLIDIQSGDDNMQRNSYFDLVGYERNPLRIYFVPKASRGISTKSQKIKEFCGSDVDFFYN